MGLLHLVQQHHRIGLAPHAFGQLSALLVTHVTRRRTNQARDGELLHILTHIDSDQVVFRSEETFGYLLGQLRLTNAGRAQEEEGAHRFVGVLQPGAVAADGLYHLADRFVLADDYFAQGGLHLHEPAAFVFRNLVDRDARHHRDGAGNIVLRHGDGLFRSGSGLPVVCSALALRFAQFCRGGEIPAQGRLPLGQPEGREFLGLGIVALRGRFQPGGCTRFVHRVDRLVGQAALRDVTAGKGDAGLQGLRGIDDVVVGLVARLDALQDGEGMVEVGRLDQDGLETALQGAVLLDDAAVFLQRGGADALQFAPRQGRFEQPGGIERTGLSAGTHQHVHFVHEEDDFRIAANLLEDGVDALLELASVLGAGHQGAHIERENPLAEQGGGDFPVGNALGEAFHDGGFAAARFTDQHRVVLLAPAENLREAQDLVVTSHHRIQLAAQGGAGQVAAAAGKAFGQRLVVTGNLQRGLQRGGVLPGRRAGAVDDLAQVDSVVEQHVPREALRRGQDGDQDVHRAGLSPFRYEARVGGRIEVLDLLGNLHLFRLFEGDDLRAGDQRLDVLFDLRQVGAQFLENADCIALAVAQNAQEKMVRRDRVTAQPDGLLTGVVEDDLQIVGNGSLHR